MAQTSDEEIGLTEILIRRIYNRWGWWLTKMSNPDWIIIVDELTRVDGKPSAKLEAAERAFLIVVGLHYYEHHWDHNYQAIAKELSSKVTIAGVTALADSMAGKLERAGKRYARVLRETGNGGG